MKANKLGFRKFGWILGQAAVLLITAALWASTLAAQGLGAGAVSRTSDDPGQSYFLTALLIATAMRSTNTNKPGESSHENID
jgi:hypothetical protein